MWVIVPSLLIGGYLLLCLLVYAMQEKLLFPSEVLPDDYKFSFPFDGELEEVWLKSSSGNIHGLWFTLPETRGVILYLHGNAGSLKDWGYVAPEFLNRGYDILIIDYREYGKSKGRLSEKGLFEDGMAAWKFLEERYEKEKIIVYGRSLGSGIAARIASEQQPSRVILETPYFSMKSRAAEQFAWLPVKWLLKYPLETNIYLSDFEGELFIIHGTEDHIISVNHSRRLADSLKNISVYREVEGGGHNDLERYQEYHDFLEQSLR